MTRSHLDPRWGNIHLDSNALQHSDAAKVARLLALNADDKINIVVPKGVRQEITHPNTPTAISGPMAAQIFSLDVELSCDERHMLECLKSVLQGNASADKHVADAEHLFEAAKYGGRYFVTHDARMLIKKRKKLDEILPPSLSIVTLNDFLAIYDDFAGRQLPDDKA